MAVLGAGYAGLSTFLDLQEHARSAGDELILIDRNPYHTFTTELHTVAGGDEDEQDVSVPLEDVVHPPASLRLAAVERVALDGPRPRVLLHGEGAIDCDALVLAVGFEPEYYGIPGAAEHSLVLEDLASAKRLRRRLHELSGGTASPRVLVVGGGLTGVELTGEIADHHHGFELTLVEGGPQIMAGFEPALVGAVRQSLDRKGVHVMLNARITEVHAGGVRLADGAGLPFEALVWTGGIRGSRIVADSGIDTNRHGQGLVDEFLRARVKGRTREDVFLAGDCSAPTDPANGGDVPPTAQTALQEGRMAARNLVSARQGRPLAPFQPRVRGMFVSVGDHEGVGRLGHTALYGLPAVALKHLVEAHHAFEAGGLASLLGRIVHAGHHANRKREAVLGS